MRPSSRRLHLLSTAGTTTVMSYRPPYRGGRNQLGRSLSGRPPNYRGGPIVTEDSHLQSVRDTNQGFQEGERGNFVNQGEFHPRTPGSVPHFNQNNQFRRPRVYYQNPQIRPSLAYNEHQHFYQPPVSGRSQMLQQKQMRPRASKSLDYRNWQYARTLPPPNCDRFVVLSYNILADYLALNHRSKLYYHIPRYVLDWEWRKRNLIFELGLWSADIMCFQEVDRFQELEEELKHRRYSGIWKMRTGDPLDGCAIFWRTSRFKLLYEDSIEFRKLGLRDNVAQICVLELMSQTGNENKAAPPSPSSAGLNRVVICNIHVLYNPRRGEIKLGQMRVLLDKAHAVSKIWDDAPVVLCGDFNCTPKSPLYNFISERKLDLSSLDRDKLSGQASAEIHAPRQSPRQYNPPNLGVASVDNSVQVPPVSDGNKADIKIITSLSDMQNQNNIDGCLENISVNNLSRDALPDVSDKTFASGQCGNEDTSACDNSDAIGVKLGQSSRLIASQSEDGSWGERSDPDSNINSERTIISSPSSFEGGNKSNSDGIDPKSVSSSDLDVSSSKQLGQIESVEVSSLGKLKSPLSQQINNHESSRPSTSCLTNNICESSNTVTGIDEKLENFSGDELEERSFEIASIGKDDSEFSSAVLKNENDFTQNPQSSPGFSVNSDTKRTTYDPSLWTPMEIKIATGEEDCTFLEHALSLKSTYTDVEDSSGTRDLNGEPLVTSYNRCFLGTVDYIWRSEGLQTVRVLAPLSKQALQWTPGFPTKKWGSDHIALASELTFKKIQKYQNTEDVE